MRIALAFVLIGSAVFAAEPFPDEAKSHGWRMLDTRARARAYASWNTIPATEAEFREMQRRFRLQDFEMWMKRTRQLRPGMAEKQVMQFLRPYFVEVFFDERTHRMISATTPLAITYEIKPDHKKPPKT